jgi:hypothetical protein
VLCFDERCHNRCFTARYRLGAGPVFGTLLATFLADLSRWQNDKLGFAGDFLPPYGDSDWDRWIATLVDDVLWPPGGEGGQLSSDRGTVPDELLERFFEATTGSLQTGQRLILLAEVSGQTAPEDWERGLATVLARLPPRVGILFCGAPEGFRLPSGDPSYLELAAIPDGSTGVSAYRYTDSALQDDRPATSDRLGVWLFADALALLVLLPETGSLSARACWRLRSSSRRLFERSSGTLPRGRTSCESA